VSTAAQLTAALVAGGTIQLACGAPFVGNFTIAKAGTTLRGIATLPAARVAEGATAACTLTPANKGATTLVITASNVTVTGLTVQVGNPDRTAVTVGSASATDPLAQPDNVVLDRIEVTAPAAGGKRGVEAHTRAFTLTRSRVVGFWFSGQDAQAFLSYNGPGPYTITDNLLQGSGENVLFGGSTIRAASLVPSNIVIRGNLIEKPLAWKTAHPGSVKNSVELKVGKTVTVENNVIDGCWRDAQPGSMIVITPRNQYSDSPWTVVQDVTIRGNRTLHHTEAFAVNIQLLDNLSLASTCATCGVLPTRGFASNTTCSRTARTASRSTAAWRTGWW
jgi:hypothetical protein